MCISLLEEAAIDGIPALVIDPKGDLGNMKLTFPDLKPSDFHPWIDEDEAARKGFSPDEYASKMSKTWKKGLADWGQDGARIKKFQDSADITIYTPGSTAGLPLTVLRSFDSPPASLADDSDALRDRVMAAVSGLLTLLGLDTDPIKSREHILLSNLLHRAWREGRNLDLPTLIREVQSPPFDKIGVFDLEAFFPVKDRFTLAMSLNNLLASPGFSAWMQGEPLNIGHLLYTPEGKPKISILSIAHLSDSERMFFVTILLNEVIAWMRTQSGTTSLRALLYMDEIYGYFPPTAVPPSKPPMLTLLKQARAFGLGVVLSTQNPVDLDYKGLSNAGTWFIGRLQTERDKDRVLDGLEGASTTAGVAFDRDRMDKIISALGKRVFLMHNVHEDHPILFNTRWALSFLRGPLTRNQIQILAKPEKTVAVPLAVPIPTKPVSPAPFPLKKEPVPMGRPVLPPGVQEFFLPLKSPLSGDERLIYRPALYAHKRLHFVNAKLGMDVWENEDLLVALSEGDVRIPWDEASQYKENILSLEKSGLSGVRFAPLSDYAVRASSYTAWKRNLKSYLYQYRTLKLWKSDLLSEVSKQEESENDFRIRLNQIAHERRDLDVEKLRKKYAPKLASLEERLRKSQARVDREKSQYGQRKMQTAISLGATVLGALFGRKVVSTGTLGRATTGMRDIGRTVREKQDIGRAQEDVTVIQEGLAVLEEEFQQELEKVRDGLSPAELDLQELLIRPRKSDILVSNIALVWTPWRVGPMGMIEPAFDTGK